MKVGAWLTHTLFFAVGSVFSGVQSMVINWSVGWLTDTALFLWCVQNDQRGAGHGDGAASCDLAVGRAVAGHPVSASCWCSTTSQPAGGWDPQGQHQPGPDTPGQECNHTRETSHHSQTCEWSTVDLFSYTLKELSAISLRLWFCFFLLAFEHCTQDLYMLSLMPGYVIISDFSVLSMALFFCSPVPPHARRPNCKITSGQKFTSDLFFLFFFFFLMEFTTDSLPPLARWPHCKTTSSRE